MRRLPSQHFTFCCHFRGGVLAGGRGPPSCWTGSPVSIKLLKNEKKRGDTGYPLRPSVRRCGCRTRRNAALAVLQRRGNDGPVACTLRTSIGQARVKRMGVGHGRVSRPCASRIGHRAPRLGCCLTKRCRALRIRRSPPTRFEGTTRSISSRNSRLRRLARPANGGAPNAKVSC